MSGEVTHESHHSCEAWLVEDEDDRATASTGSTTAASSERTDHVCMVATSRRKSLRWASMVRKRGVHCMT